MAFASWIKKLFGCTQPTIPSIEIVKDESLTDPDKIEEEIKKLDENMEKFQVENVVLEKLNYLEQYIKSFASTFPNEYNNFLQLIIINRTEYEKQLESYRAGLVGNITFAIDPERDTHYLAILSLEGKINHFVDFVVCFDVHKKKFVTLCTRLNEFYNTIVSVCKYYGIEYIDNTHSSIFNRANITSLLLDGVHPTPEAYVVMGKELAKKINLK